MACSLILKLFFQKIVLGSDIITQFFHIRDNISNYFGYILSFFIILQCNSIFNGTFVNIVTQLLIFVLFLKSILKIFNNRNIFKIILFVFLFILIMSMFLLLNFYVNHYSINYIFFLLFDPIMFIVYFFSCLNRNNYITPIIFFDIENIIILLSLLSVLFWTLANLGMHPNTYHMSYWDGGKLIPGYSYVFYVPQGITKLFGINVFRNCGIFQEAPMYSYILCIGLLIELFIRQDKKMNYRIFILIITIFTTNSLLGIIIGTLSIMYLLLVNNNLSLKMFIILLSPFIFVMFKILFLGKIENGPSYVDRILDISTRYQIWKNHLIIGNGMGYDIGSSDGLFSTLASGGVILSLFYIIPTFGVSKISFKYKGLAIFSFILYMFTAINDVEIYILLLSYFWIVLLFESK